MIQDWNLPIETVPCQFNPVPVPCEVVAGMSDDVHAFVTVTGPWLCEGYEPDFDPATDPEKIGRHIGERSWWFLRSEMGASHDGLPTLRNVAVEEITPPTE